MVAIPAQRHSASAGLGDSDGHGDSDVTRMLARVPPQAAMSPNGMNK